MEKYIEKTIGRMLKDTVAKFPENEAMVYPELGLRVSYREFLENCRKVAKGYMALGVKKGDHVSVWATNVPEWIYSQFALSMIGGVFVTVNTSYKTQELSYIIKQSDSTTLVLIEKYKDTNYYETVRDVVGQMDNMKPGEIFAPELPNLKNIIYIGERGNTPGMLSWNDFLKSGETISDEQLDAREESLHHNDVINMQYTSGTTGFPKGVMLTHYNILNDAYMVGEVMGMTEKDRLLIHVPLFHCFGCVMSSLNSICFGSTMVVMEFFDALKSIRAIHNEKITAINGVPTMFIAMLSHPEYPKYDMSSLRTGIMAGSPCPVEVMNKVRTTMHCPEIVIAFGQTECSPVMTMTRRDDPVEIRVSTVGRLLDGIEGKIVDPETGKDLGPDQQGEIVTRSPCVMSGYYKMPEATARVIDKEGWLHTGDLGTVDRNGNFRVTGRIKDMIIRGGENIYPREVEEFLYKHPKVSDVQVVGIADEKYGEVVLAAIKVKEGESITEEELLSFCKGQIANHKIPKYWEFVSGFPMTASGKIQKFKLREEFSKKYFNKVI